MRLLLFTFFFLILTPILSYAKEDEETGEIIIDIIHKIFPGFYETEFTNENSSDKKLTNDRFPITTIILPFENSNIGENLFYLEEFRDNNPSQVIRRRVYYFWSENNKVKLKLLNPREELNFTPLDNDYTKDIDNRLEFVRSLNLDDFRPDRDVCILNISQYEERVVARMQTRLCDREETWIDYELIINGKGMWTCFSRRKIEDDSLFWLQMADFPCIWQNRNLRDFAS